MIRLGAIVDEAAHLGGGLDALQLGAPLLPTLLLLLTPLLVVVNTSLIVDEAVASCGGTPCRRADPLSMRTTSPPAGPHVRTPARPPGHPLGHPRLRAAARRARTCPHQAASRLPWEAR